MKHQPFHLFTTTIIIFTLLIHPTQVLSSLSKNVEYHLYNEGFRPHKLFLDAMKKSEILEDGRIYFIFDNRSMNAGHWISGVLSPGMDYFDCLESKTVSFLDSIVEVKEKNEDPNRGGVFMNLTVRNVLSLPRKTSFDPSEEISRIHHECSGGGSGLDDFISKMMNPFDSKSSCGGSKTGKSEMTRKRKKQLVENMTDGEIWGLTVIFFIIFIPWVLVSWVCCCYLKCFFCYSRSE